MQNPTTAKERFRYHNSLVGLAKALELKHTVIDLRNESCVSGLIKKVDGYMNVEMENVVFYDAQGGEHEFEEFFVSARNIRYVHIPKELSVKDLIENQISSLHRVRKKEPKPAGLKKKRAQKYNDEIKQELRERKAGPSNLD